MAKRITRERPLQSQYLCYYTLPMFQGAHGVFETRFFFTTWRRKEPATRSGPVIAIIITPTDTHRLCGLQAQHLFRTVIVTFGSWAFPTGPDLPSAQEKPALPPQLRNVFTFQHKMEYHLAPPASCFAARHSNEHVPLFHSLLLSNVRAFLRRYKRTARRLGF